MTPHPPSPRRPTTRERGLIAHAQGDLDTAASFYRQALREDPTDADSTHYLGAVALARGAVATAISWMGRATRLAPDNGVFHYNLALAARMDKRDDLAMRHLRAALASQPDLPDAHYHLGLITLSRQAHREAAHAFARARDLPEVADLLAENIRYIETFHTGERAHERPARRADTPLISVVIPCVNYGQFIGEAVASCLAQTHTNIEVVVVEGGSTDGVTPAVVRALDDPRIRKVFRSPIRPVGDNRNFGIGVARGAYVCCLDADDALAPDYLEKALFCLTSFGYDVVGAGVRTFGAMDATRDFLRRPRLEDFQRTNQLSTAALFRRAWWERAGGFYDHDRANGFVHEDWNFWFRLSALGARIMNINWEHLIRYRQHGFERLTGKTTMLPLDKQIAIIRAQNTDVLAPSLIPRP